MSTVNQYFVSQFQEQGLLKLTSFLRPGENKLNETGWSFEYDTKKKIK